MENRGNISKSMREAGYSKATAKNPKNLTASKGWNEIMQVYLPEENLAKLHKQQLRSKRTVFYNKKKYKIEDNEARLRALDIAYKILGKYKPTKIEVRTFEGWTPTELENYAKHDIVPDRFKGMGFEGES